MRFFSFHGQTILKVTKRHAVQQSRSFSIIIVSNYVIYFKLSRVAHSLGCDYGDVPLSQAQSFKIACWIARKTPWTLLARRQAVMVSNVATTVFLQHQITDSWSLNMDKIFVSSSQSVVGKKPDWRLLQKHVEIAWIFGSWLMTSTVNCPTINWCSTTTKCLDHWQQ